MNAFPPQVTAGVFVQAGTVNFTRCQFVKKNLTPEFQGGYRGLQHPYER